MTETDPSSDRPDASRLWGIIVLKAVAGALMLLLARGWYFGEVPDQYKLADFHQHNAAIAVAHAVADGRAREVGYPEMPPDVQEFVGETTPAPTFAPVPIEQAEAAVAANTALASYYTTQATEARTAGQFLMGGAGAAALVGVSLLYPLASVVAEGAERAARQMLAGTGSASRRSRPEAPQATGADPAAG